MSSQPCISVKLDRETNKAIRHVESIDHAMQKNPHPYGSDDYQKWCDLVRAKWGIAHSESVLISQRRK